jgi:hypothetical protein
MKTLLVAALSALLAPYQCSHADQTDRPIEDTAPKALHILAERFSSQGDNSACETVIAQLIEQYPSSRYAKAARDEGACNGTVAPKPRAKEPEPEPATPSQEEEAPPAAPAADEPAKADK